MSAVHGEWPLGTRLPSRDRQVAPVRVATRPARRTSMARRRVPARPAQTLVVSLRQHGPLNGCSAGAAATPQAMDLDSFMRSCLHRARSAFVVSGLVHYSDGTRRRRTGASPFPSHSDAGGPAGPPRRVAPDARPHPARGSTGVPLEAPGIRALASARRGLRTHRQPPTAGSRPDRRTHRRLSAALAESFDLVRSRGRPRLSALESPTTSRA